MGFEGKSRLFRKKCKTGTVRNTIIKEKKSQVLHCQRESRKIACRAKDKTQVAWLQGMMPNLMALEIPKATAYESPVFLREVGHGTEKGQSIERCENGTDLEGMGAKAQSCLVRIALECVVSSL